MKDGGLDFYFNSGALANMQAGGSAYYSYADKNWPAIQVRGVFQRARFLTFSYSYDSLTNHQNMSAGKAFAPYCFNTNLVVTNSSSVDDDEAWF
jgi:hypothetical protein